MKPAPACVLPGRLAGLPAACHALPSRPYLEPLTAGLQAGGAGCRPAVTLCFPAWVLLPGRKNPEAHAREDNQGLFSAFLTPLKWGPLEANQQECGSCSRGSGGWGGGIGTAQGEGAVTSSAELITLKGHLLRAPHSPSLYHCK